MSIDPRIMKTMLQLQLSPFAGYSSGSADYAGGTSGGASPFELLLSQLLDDPLGFGVSSYNNYTNDAPYGGLSGGSLPGAFGGSTGLPPELLFGQLYRPLGAASMLRPNVDVAAAYRAGAYPAGAHATGVPTDFEPLIRDASIRYGVNPSLIKAVIHTESSFNPHAVSSAGAKGLMQLMDATARGLGVSDAFDPRQNIDGGTRYLAYLLDKYGGHVTTALAAYNAGPGRIDQLGIRTDEDVERMLSALPAETQRYIRKVADALDKYSG